MIYESLFKAGSVELTRVSKTMNEDTKASLSEHGVYHVTITRYEDDFDCHIAGVVFDPLSHAFPTHVGSLTLNFQPKPLRAARLSDECTENLRNVVVGIIAQLGKTKHCRLKFGTLDRGAPVVAALKVLRNFECVTMEMVTGDPYPSRDIAVQRHDIGFVPEETNLAAIRAAFRAQGGLKATASLTIQYLDQDNWVKGLGNTEKDDYLLYRLSETEACNMRQGHHSYYIFSDDQMRRVGEKNGLWIETCPREWSGRFGTMSESLTGNRMSQ